jgi:hypothetical protein
MNVNRLRQVGNPPAPPIAPEVFALRYALDRRYKRAVDARDRYESRRGDRTLGSGRRLESEPYCGDCHAIRSPLASEPGRACGSTQPPNLSRMNPYARHIAGESPLR